MGTTRGKMQEGGRQWRWKESTEERRKKQKDQHVDRDRVSEKKEETVRRKEGKERRGENRRREESSSYGKRMLE